MDVVFEGALSKSWGMKDVLKAVMEVPNVPYGVLRVSCPKKELQGKILISQSRHVVGASSSSNNKDLDAYDALRSLIEITEGNFAYLDLASDSATDFDQSLFICIERLLDLMPELPLAAGQLFDEKSLLDKVFGEESTSPYAELAKSQSIAMTIPMAAPNRRKALKSNSNKSAPITASSITQWNIVEPLTSNPQAKQKEHIDCCSNMIPDFVQTPDEQRSSMNRLRALPASSQEQKGWGQSLKTQAPLKWLLAALGLSILICFVHPQILPF